MFKTKMESYDAIKVDKASHPSSTDSMLYLMTVHVRLGALYGHNTSTLYSRGLIAFKYGIYPSFIQIMDASLYVE